MRIITVGITAVAVLLTGCSFYRINPSLSHNDLTAKSGYRYRNLAAKVPEGSRRNFVVVTMSGGGTRAAALSYGVVQAMDNVKVDSNGATLLDQVDVISSISGGSFTAAYLGLFGKEEFFRSFRAEVLDRQIERDVLLRVIAPWNWPEMVLYGRSDVADQYYNDEIFRGRSFADMPHRRPYVILNATDLTIGAAFSFTQDDFDRFCSSLETIPVSRAVLASSAFPVAFTPLTMKNYGWTECGYQQPLWVTGALQDFEVNPVRYHRAQVWASYQDAVAKPFIHLSDGGLADNIGLRGPEIALTSTDSPWTQLNNRQLDRVVVIVVDAKPAKPLGLDQSPRRPSATTVLAASATNPMENYSFDTVNALRLFIEEQNKATADFQFRQQKCGEMAAQLCTGDSNSVDCQNTRRAQCYDAFNASDNFRPPNPKYYEIHVQFEAIKDPDERQRVSNIPTALQLSADDVDLLIKEGGQILSQSPDYQRLVKDLQANPSAR